MPGLVIAAAAWLAALAPPVPAATTGVTVRATPVEGFAVPSAAVELVALRAGVGLAAADRWPLGGVARVVPSGLYRAVTCEGEPVWCPVVPLPHDGAERADVELPVYPAMTIRARLASPAADPLPKTCRVQGAVRGTALELREEPIVTDGRILFRAPRAELDLRLALPERVPIYRWGLHAPPAPGELDLGSLTVHRGGSLAGWVRDRASDLPLGSATVRLAPAARGRAASGSSLRGPAATRSDPSGFFQLPGLEPGTYRLEVEQAERAPLVIDGLHVEADAETMVGALLLDRHLVLRVQLDPPIDPSGGQWSLEVRPTHPREAEEGVISSATTEGLAELGRLRPGEYTVTVGPAGDGTLHLETVNLSHDQWLDLEIPVVTVVGSVRLGGEPLAARIGLLTGAGDSVELTSDGEGEFRGWMRRPGRRWLVATVSWEVGGRPRSRRLEIEPAELEGDVLRLDLDLPAGSIHGEVVDLEGAPVYGARVVARPDGRAGMFAEQAVTTDGSGRFELEGLDRRPHSVQASTRDGRASEVESVDLTGVSPAGTLRLVIGAKRTLKGVLTSAAGERLGDVWIDLHVAGSGAAPPLTTATVTRTDGSFEVDLPAEARRAVVTAFALSQMLWSACLDVGEDTLALRLPPPPGGALRLHLRSREDLPPALGGYLVAVTGEGGLLPVTLLSHWRERLGAERRDEGRGGASVEILEVPAVSAMTYRLVWTTAPLRELAAAACSGALLGPDAVFASPGQTVDLELDVTPYQGCGGERGCLTP